MLPATQTNYMYLVSSITKSTAILQQHQQRQWHETTGSPHQTRSAVTFVNGRQVRRKAKHSPAQHRRRTNHVVVQVFVIESTAHNCHTAQHDVNYAYTSPFRGSGKVVPVRPSVRSASLRFSRFVKLILICNIKKRQAVSYAVQILSFRF